MNRRFLADVLFAAVFLAVLTGTLIVLALVLTREAPVLGTYRDSGATEWDATQEVRAATLEPPMPGECVVFMGRCTSCATARRGAAGEE